tara:strand:- start:533 stop:1489 length:957 start_codon:yes stop_codon:yes gene_type:complete
MLKKSKDVTDKIYDHIYECENIVIGSRLNAVMYAFLNNYPLLLNKHEPPLPFELFPHETNLNNFNVDNLEIGLTTLNGVEKFGNPKLELWKRLCYCLSLSGLMPLSNNASSMRIEDDVLKVFVSNTKLIRFKFSQLHVFDGDNVEGLVGQTREKLYQVTDWINVRSGMVHEYDRIETDSPFVNCIHFYPSDRIEGKHDKKDLVAISYLTEEQLSDIIYSDTYVRFKTKSIMKEIGIRGKRNGKNPNYPHSSQQPYKHVALTLENKSREVRLASANLYEDAENVLFKKCTEEELCMIEPCKSNAKRVNKKIIKQDLLYR